MRAQSAEIRNRARLNGMRRYENRLGWRNKGGRLMWRMAYWLLYRWSPQPCMFWRRFLLRCFGANVASGANAYPTTRIWAPWNLTMERYSCLAADVDCYCVAPITLGEFATVSQYSHLCGAGHDYNHPDFV